MKRICIFISSLMIMLPVFPQQDSMGMKLSTFVKNTYTFGKLYPQEKVYLHFDNTGYFLGETIWFKAYIVSAENLRPAQLSRILYVELLTQEGECIKTLKLKIENGQCHGDFKLDTEYRSGFYEIRAYTRAMLNFGDDVIFSRVFPIYKEPEEDGDYKTKDMSEPYSRSLENKRIKPDKRRPVNVDFYPEGGNLIRGLTNRVAFRITGKNGENLNVQGKLYGPDKQEITRFSTQHQGMGFFSFSPEKGKYKITVACNNDDYDFELPAALPSGYAMFLNNFRDDVLNVGIQKTLNLPASTLGLSVTCRGKLCFFNTLRIESETWELAIPKQVFPEGVNCITLFNNRGEVLSERLFFVNRPPEVTFTCQQDKERYKALEKIRLDFSVKDSNGQAVETTFSVSVRDASSSSIIAYGSNIRNNLLLSSDLKGYIEQPDYYFESNDNTHKQALDLLMMTQGWRRYVWRQMAGIEPIKIKHHIEESLVIKGRALNLYNSKPLPEVQLACFLTREDSAGESGESKTDKDGNFAFLLPDTLTGKWDLTLQTFTKGKLLKSRILLDRIFSPKGKAYAGYEMQDLGTLAVLDEETEKEEENPKRSISEIQVLKEVVVKTRKAPKIHPSEIYHVDREINEKMDIGKSYPATIAGYLISKDNNFEWAGENRLIYEKVKEDKLKNVIIYPFFTRNKDILIDLSDSSMLKRESMKVNFHLNNDIETVESISIYRNADVLSMDPKNKSIWNPNVKTDEQGKANIMFYNNSSCRKIDISAEGIIYP